jgi:integrase
MLFTGMRRGEATGLTWDSFDQSKKTLTINKQLRYLPSETQRYSLVPPKRDKPRTISIPQTVVDILLNEKDIQNKSKLDAGPLWSGYKDECERETSLIFTSKLGLPIDFSTLHAHYKKVAKSIGIPESHIHQLRHTYAVLALQNGDEIKTVQDNLGHSSIAFTLDVYGHTTDKMKKASAERMQNFIESVSQDNHKGE